MESFWNWKIKKNHFVSYIGFIKEVNKSSIYLTSGIGVHNLYDENTDVFSSFVKISNDLMQEGVIKEDRHIRICIDIYFMILGQSMLFNLKTVNNYSLMHEIINNSEDLLSSVERECKSVASRDKLEDLLEFLKYSKSYFKQYRGMVYFEQGNYTSCINSVFEAIHLQPYFPTKSYEEFKSRSIQQYGIIIGNSLPTVIDVLEESIEDNEKETLPDVELVNSNRNRLEQSLTHKDLIFHYEVLELLVSINIPDFNKKLLKEKLNNLTDELEINLFVKAEILRQIENKNKEGNELGIVYLSKLLEKDPSFSVAHLKMGSWIFANVEYMTDKKKVEKEIHKAVEIMAKGYNLINMTGYN